MAKSSLWPVSFQRDCLLGRGPRIVCWIVSLNMLGSVFNQLSIPNQANRELARISPFFAEAELARSATSG